MQIITTLDCDHEERSDAVIQLAISVDCHSRQASFAMTNVMSSFEKSEVAKQLIERDCFVLFEIKKSPAEDAGLLIKEKLN